MAKKLGFRKPTVCAVLIHFVTGRGAVFIAHHGHAAHFETILHGDTPSRIVCQRGG